MRIEMATEGGQVLLSVEAESFVEHLRKFKLKDVGNSE